MAASSLRVAMVAPPYFAVPPDAYGGIEAVVAALVDALVERGHHLTLVAAGARGTTAQEYLPTRGLPEGTRIGEVAPEVVHAARAALLVRRLPVDVVHDHTLAGPLTAAARPAPTVVTVHSELTGDTLAYYRALDGVHLVAISEFQRACAPDLPWLATVHNGIDVASYPYRAVKEPFLLFLARLHPEKGAHLAIDAARAAGLPLVLAGKCTEPIEREYFARELAPRLGRDVSYFGVADAAAKRDLLARAMCLLLPLQWDEPFGLVMVEAMACGTPVVALRRGAVPEVVEDGVTGSVVDDVLDLPVAVHAVSRIDPAACRRRAEQRFDVATMASGYERAYRALAEARSALVPSARSAPISVLRSVT